MGVENEGGSFDQNTIDRMILAVVKRQNDIREQLIEVQKEQARLLEIIEQVVTKRHELEHIHRRIRRIEKLMNLPAKLEDRET